MSARNNSRLKMKKWKEAAYYAFTPVDLWSCSNGRRCWNFARRFAGASKSTDCHDSLDQPDYRINRLPDGLLYNKDVRIIRKD